MKSMKFISWNVNGLRACVGKGFDTIFNELDADFFCLQETKMQAGMNHIGIMPRRKDIPAQPYTPSTSLYQYATA